MNGDYKIELENDDIHELEMFADIKEEELADYDTVDVLDITGTFRNEGMNIEKFLDFPDEIVGDNLPSRRIPNFYKTDINNLLKPTYKALISWEDARSLANLTILELFGFDLIKDIWKNLKNNNSITVVYDSVFEEIGEYTGALINFVICALRYRGILALDISKYMKNKRCIFVAKERLNKQELVRKIQMQEVVVKANLLLTINSRDILYNAFIYNLNTVERYKRASRALREYNSTVYERNREIADTLANAKSVYKAGFNLMFSMVSLYYPKLTKEVNCFNNDGLEYIWNKLPGSQQSEFENLYYSLYNLYEMTKGFTEGGMRLDLMRIKLDINRFFEYVRQYFNSKFDCQACMQLPQEDMIKILLDQFDIEEKAKHKQEDSQQVQQEENTKSEPMTNFDNAEPINREFEQKSSSYVRRHATRTPAKETLADKAKRRYQEKKDNGDFRQMRKSATKVGKNTASKFFGFCKNNPKTVVTVIGISFIFWILYRLVHLIASIF